MKIDIIPICDECAQPLKVKLSNFDGGTDTIRLYVVPCEPCMKLKVMQAQSAGMKKAREILLKLVEAKN